MYGRCRVTALGGTLGQMWVRVEKGTGDEKAVTRVALIREEKGRATSGEVGIIYIN